MKKRTPDFSGRQAAVHLREHHEDPRHDEKTLKNYLYHVFAPGLERRPDDDGGTGGAQGAPKTAGQKTEAVGPMAAYSGGCPDR